MAQSVMLALLTVGVLVSAAAADGVARAALVRNRANQAVAGIQMSIATNKLSKGPVAQAFKMSSAPRFLAANFVKNQKLTILVPTNRAYYRYVNSWPRLHCTQPPFSNVLAGMILNGEFTGRQLKALKRGTKLRTMSTLYLTTLSKPSAKTVQLAVVNGYQKVVAVANVVKADAYANKRANAVIHYVDNILMSC